MSGQLARSIGRPSKYSAQIAESICWRMAHGESLRSICRDPEMPDDMAIYRWIEKYPAFRGQYARAREIQSHYYAEKQLEVAAGAHDIASAAAARVQADALRWIASKLNPKVYGDKMLHTGADGEGPIEHRLDLDYKLLSDTELAEFKRLLEKAMRKQIAAPAALMIEGEVVEDGEE